MSQREEEQDVRAAPDDLATSIRLRAQGRPARTRSGRFLALVRSVHRPRPLPYRALPHPDPALALGM